MRRRHLPCSAARTVATLLALPLLLGGVACSDDAGDAGGAGDRAPGDGGSPPSIVVTTSVLGDVVANMVGDLASVGVVMGPGTDPHDFQASAQQVASLRDADVLVTNGAGFEQGLLDTIESAEADGTTVCRAMDSVEPLARDEDDHDSGHDSDHGEAAGAGSDHESDDATVDPHFFTDPSRMAQAVDGLTDCIASAVPALNTDEFRSQSSAYVEQLQQLDAGVEAALAGIPAERRVLVTDHDVFGYFADRYDFEVAGAIVGSTTQAEADASNLAELARIVESTGVPAVFVTSSSPAPLAEALAGEVGDIEVVTLSSESLGSDSTSYVEMVDNNAERIAGALG